MRTCLLLGRGGAVDLGENAAGPVMLALQSGLFGFAGGTQLAEEGLGPGGVVSPDGSMARVVGGLRTAGRITHARQRPVGVRCSGEFQTQRSGRIGEPAEVRCAQMQRLGAFRQKVEDFSVVALHSRRPGCLTCALRERTKLSQQDVADRMGVSQPRVSKIEQGDPEQMELETRGG